MEPWPAHSFDCWGAFQHVPLCSGETEIALIDRKLGSTFGAALASLIPYGARRSIETAALINGVAAHVLDYDDVGLAIAAIAQRRRCI